jgi:serine/threonine protein kinase
VVKACNNKISGEPFAVKIVKKQGLSDADEDGLRTEVRILKSLDSPYIIKCIDFFEDKFYYYVVMEYLEGLLIFTIYLVLFAGNK